MGNLLFEKGQNFERKMEAKFIDSINEFSLDLLQEVHNRRSDCKNLSIFVIRLKNQDLDGKVEYIF